MSSVDKANQIESYLDHAMRSVRPPDEVVQRLRQRIGSLEPHIIAKRISNWELSIITIGSVMFAATVIVTIARAFFYFFGRGKRSA